MQATTKQINYMEILFNDLGFDRKARNAFLSTELGRPINYLDALQVEEARRIITALLERKDDSA